jgi:hypothetical protein
MLVNDPIQGILFDTSEKVLFINNKTKAQKAIDLIIKVRKLNKSAITRRKNLLSVSSRPHLQIDYRPSEQDLAKRLNKIDLRRSR